MTSKNQRAEQRHRRRHSSGDFLHEDIAQERALAELLGKTFSDSDARIVERSLRPRQELSFANVEIVLYGSRDDSLRQSRSPGGSFIREKARHRDQPLVDLLRVLIEKGLSYREIAAELTQRGVPKVHSWAANRPWSTGGARDLVKKLGMRSKPSPEKRIEGCKKGGRTRGDQMSSMKRSTLRQHMRLVGAGISPRATELLAYLSPGVA